MRCHVLTQGKPRYPWVLGGWTNQTERRARVATVTISWTVEKQAFPAGTTYGKCRAKITGGALVDPISMDTEWSPAVFTNVPPDDPPAPEYIASVQMMDASNMPLGAPMTQTFSVLSPPAVDIDIPVTVKVVVAP